MTKTKLPTTVWKYSLNTEADRLVQTATNTFNRFYLKYNFLVLPYLVKKNPEGVYLPDFEWQKKPKFTQALSRLPMESQIPVTGNPSFLKPIRENLIRIGWKPEETKIKKLKETWQKKERDFWKTAAQVVPQLREKNITVEIRPTSFGTVSSFSIISPLAHNWPIRFYLRTDQTVAKIAWCILTSLFWKKISAEGYLWSERIAFIDNLLKQTALGQVFPNYASTLLATKKKDQGRLVQDSQKYLKKLHLVTKEIFTIKDDQILLDNQNAFLDLSSQEKKLLLYLVEQKNQVCSPDQLAETLWQEESYDRFSPWAIAKIIERLRKKFLEGGLSPALIQTHKGRGYLLKD
ncbi:helix-turn-helix domain-containing protein [Patescibacteria group bacterium]